MKWTCAIDLYDKTDMEWKRLLCPFILNARPSKYSWPTTQPLLCIHGHRTGSLKSRWLFINNLFAETCCSRADKSQQDLDAWGVLHVPPRSLFTNQIPHKMLLIYYIKMKGEETYLRAALCSNTYGQLKRDPRWALPNARGRKGVHSRPHHIGCIQESEQLQIP